MNCTALYNVTKRVNHSKPTLTLPVLIDINGKRSSFSKCLLSDCLVWTHSKGKKKSAAHFFMLVEPNVSWCHHPYQHFHPSCSLSLPACATTHTADVQPQANPNALGDSLFGLRKLLETTHSMHTVFPQVTV